jgi:hypothetical protein
MDPFGTHKDILDYYVKISSGDILELGTGNTSTSIVKKYINENPEISDDKGAFGCYDKKPYYNVLLDDKASFNPETDWKPIYDYFVNSEYRPNPNWNLKTVEKYHK